jgi:hypothetical protein
MYTKSPFRRGGPCWNPNPHGLFSSTGVIDYCAEILFVNRASSIPPRNIIDDALKLLPNDAASIFLQDVFGCFDSLRRSQFTDEHGHFALDSVSDTFGWFKVDCGCD